MVFFNSRNGTFLDSARLTYNLGLDLSRAVSAGLTFWMFHDNVEQSGEDNIKVQVSVDGSHGNK